MKIKFSIFTFMISLILIFPFANGNALSCKTLSLDELISSLGDDGYAFIATIDNVISSDRADVIVTNNYSRKPINKNITVYQPESLFNIDFNYYVGDQFFIVGSMYHDDIVKISPCTLGRVKDGYVIQSFIVGGNTLSKVSIDKFIYYDSEIISDKFNFNKYSIFVVFSIIFSLLFLITYKRKKIDM